MGQGFAHERLPEKGTVLLLDTYDLTEILKECQSYGKTFIQNNVIHALEPSLSSVDSNIREIRESRNNRSSACREMERLQGECRKLITEVHSM